MLPGENIRPDDDHFAATVRMQQQQLQRIPEVKMPDFIRLEPVHRRKIFPRRERIDRRACHARRTVARRQRRRRDRVLAPVGDVKPSALDGNFLHLEMLDQFFGRPHRGGHTDRAHAQAHRGDENERFGKNSHLPIWPMIHPKGNVFLRHAPRTSTPPRRTRQSRAPGSRSLLRSFRRGGFRGAPSP